jgi:hypothetical protein
MHRRKPRARRPRGQTPRFRDELNDSFSWRSAAWRPPKDNRLSCTIEFA